MFGFFSLSHLFSFSLSLESGLIKTEILSHKTAEPKHLTNQMKLGPRSSYGLFKNFNFTLFALLCKDTAQRLFANSTKEDNFRDYSLAFLDKEAI